MKSNFFLNVILIGNDCLLGPDDYVESTQELEDIIQVLDTKEGIPTISLSDSNTELIPPSPPEAKRAARL